MSSVRQPYNTNSVITMNYYDETTTGACLNGK